MDLGRLQASGLLIKVLQVGPLGNRWRQQQGLALRRHNLLALRQHNRLHLFHSLCMCTPQLRVSHLIRKCRDRQ